jgi:hypothetical protein
MVNNRHMREKFALESQAGLQKFDKNLLFDGRALSGRLCLGWT